VIPTLILQSLPQGNALLQFLPMLLIFAIFYFLLFMPMQRQKKAQREMIAGLKAGAKVQTTGGVIGTIVSVGPEDDTLVLRVKPDGIKLQIARNAVAGVLSEDKS
jgi:preprotein translocase subunit YajC